MKIPDQAVRYEVAPCPYCKCTTIVCITSDFVCVNCGHTRTIFDCGLGPPLKDEQPVRDKAILNIIDELDTDGFSDENVTQWLHMMAERLRKALKEE